MTSTPDKPQTTNQRPDEPPPGWIVSGGALCGPDGIWHVAETRDHALDVAWSAWREANDATDPTTEQWRTVNHVTDFELTEVFALLCAAHPRDLALLVVRLRGRLDLEYQMRGVRQQP